jgi:hypothetical protein
VIHCETATTGARRWFATGIHREPRRILAILVTARHPRIRARTDSWPAWPVRDHTADPLGSVEGP